jgi:hypothetical protein
VLNEIIPTAPIQVDRQFCKFIPLFKAEHSEKRLDRYRKSFGMSPIIWAEADLFRTAFPIILVKKSTMGVMSLEGITY